MTKKQTFEEAIRRLEQIAQELEDGDVSLADSIKKFEEGMKLSQFCSQQLEEAKQKVTILLKKNGELEEKAFDAIDNE